MAVETIDMSLEEIIKQKKSSRMPRQPTSGVPQTGKSQTGGRKNGPRKAGPVNNGGKPRDPLRRTKTGGVKKQKASTTKREATATHIQKQETKLFISNLHANVVDSDIQSLFSDFGGMKRAHVHFSQTGASLGSAEVVFSTANSAQKAKKTYDGVTLDGKPMHVQFAVSQMAALPRVTPRGTPQGKAPAQGQPKMQGKASRRRQNHLQMKPTNQTKAQDTKKQRGKSVTGRGSRVGARRGGKARNTPMPSAADLDKQLDDYHMEKDED